MRSPFDRVAEDTIRDVVRAGWGLPVDELRYFPEGGGAYHWIANPADAQRWFVTCDDLDTKPWLGIDPDTVFDGLTVAYGTAMDLREAGLGFVAAPLASHSGAPAERIDERHSLSVFDFVDGVLGQWGQPVDDRARDELVVMLARLHQSTSGVRTVARRAFALPGRDDLSQALDDLGIPWEGGPLSELARAELATHEDVIARWLDELDRFGARLGSTGAEGVVTHGEPHPGNLIHTSTGAVLVDWDTVAVARPERDLWMIAADDTGVVTAYRDLTGHTLENEALEAYRLLWALSDLAAFTAQLRGEHRADADADKALAAIRSILARREPSPYGSVASRGDRR